MKKKIFIFSKRILPRSNTFIASQSLNLPTIKPVFIGYKKDLSGIDMLEGNTPILLNESTSTPKISKLLIESFHYLPPKWKDQLRQEDAQLIHAHFGKNGYYCTGIAKSLNLPLITTFHGSDITQKNKFSYRQKHKNIIFGKSDKIIAISNFIKRKLLERGCPEDKLIRHNIGIDNHFFTPSKSKDSEPTILFVGRLIEQKGCQFLLQSMKIIQDKIPEAKLIIAGYGPYKPKLEEFASRLKNIHFCGPQNREQIRSLMDRAWITCLPSIRMAAGNEEGLSMVCLESQAMGTPIIAFNTGGVGEAIEHEKSGILVPEKDIGLLSSTAIELLSNNALRRTMSDYGIQRIDNLFNITRQCELLERVYFELM